MKCHTVEVKAQFSGGFEVCCEDLRKVQSCGRRSSRAMPILKTSGGESESACEERRIAHHWTCPRSLRIFNPRRTRSLYSCRTFSARSDSTPIPSPLTSTILPRTGATRRRSIALFRTRCLLSCRPNKGSPPPRLRRSTSRVSERAGRCHPSDLWPYFDLSRKRCRSVPLG